MYLVSHVDGVSRSLVHMALESRGAALIIHNFIGRARESELKLVETFSIFAWPRTTGVLGRNPRASVEFASIATRVTVLKPTASLRDHARRLSCLSWPVGRARTTPLDPKHLRYSRRRRDPRFGDSPTGRLGARRTHARVFAVVRPPPRSYH